MADNIRRWQQNTSRCPASDAYQAVCTSLQADWIIYITDAGQADHFKLVFASARRAGILPASEDEAPRVSHVGFGLVLGDDGKRFRTRSSEVRSWDLLGSSLVLAVLHFLRGHLLYPLTPRGLLSSTFMLAGHVCVVFSCTSSKRASVATPMNGQQL